MRSLSAFFAVRSFDFLSNASRLLSPPPRRQELRHTMLAMSSTGFLAPSLPCSSLDPARVSFPLNPANNDGVGSVPPAPRRDMHSEQCMMSSITQENPACESPRLPENHISSSVFSEVSSPLSNCFSLVLMPAHAFWAFIISSSVSLNACGAGGRKSSWAPCISRGGKRRGERREGEESDESGVLGARSERLEEECGKQKAKSGEGSRRIEGGERREERGERGERREERKDDGCQSCAVSIKG
eukprot:3834474-Rhodomonas_salina.2